MKSLFSIFIFFATIYHSHSQITKSSRDYAIQIAINDFVALKKLHATDKVFSVKAEELTQNNSILIITIIAKTSNLLLTKDVKIGSKGKIASRYIEQDDKLFYWWDDDYPLSQDALSIYGKYGLLQDDMNGTIKFPDAIVNDARKGASYYFCKDNPEMFKRIITNIATGYYTPPTLNCDSLKN
jgi:hypothetical protein